MTPKGEIILDSLTFARNLVNVLEDNKAEDIVLLDLRPDTIIADFFVLGNGNSDRHLRALTEHVREAAKDDFGKRPFSVQGTPESGWMLLDFSDVVVHLFIEEKREYYDLDGLWSEMSNILVSIQ
jgi:ribosome-associated protein